MQEYGRIGGYLSYECEVELEKISGSFSLRVTWDGFSDQEEESQFAWLAAPRERVLTYKSMKEQKELWKTLLLQFRGLSLRVRRVVAESRGFSEL
jgi:hypothetical protein